MATAVTWQLRTLHFLTFFFFLLLPRPPTPTLFPYTTLFRSDFPVLPVIQVPVPPISRRDEEGFSSCSVHPCHRAVEKRSEEHTSELQSRGHLVCRLLLEKKKHTEYEQESTVRSRHK